MCQPLTRESAKGNRRSIAPTWWIEWINDFDQEANRGKLTKVLNPKK